MNYRHAFHAGNHADVLKHIVLTRLIALMSRKEQPFAYIDTHAGLGLYDLQGDQATRTGEYLEGVARLWNRDDLPAMADDYLRIIKRLNADGELRYYPGSPELARRLMRQQDRALLNEKHPEDGPLLKENMKKDPRVTVHLGEGWHVPRALLPVQEKRAIMLIDPQQLRCASAGQVLVKAGQRTLVLDRVPDCRHRLAHAANRFFHGRGAALELVGLLERRVDQHDRALFLHGQQGPRHVPAFTQVHGNARVFLHVRLSWPGV